MALGWTLVESGEYCIPWDVQLSGRQVRVLDLVLDAYALLPAKGSCIERLESCLKCVCTRERILLNASWSEKVLFLAERQVEGAGFFSHFLLDDDVEEIAAIGLNKPVFVYVRSQGWRCTNAVILSQEFAVSAVNALARPLGRRLTVKNPRLSAILSDGSRLHACMTPLSPDGFLINVRKFRRKPFTVNEMVAGGFLTRLQAAFFSLALVSDVGLLVAGNTGSGKTTLLNALSSFIPANERIVVVEDVPELRFRHVHQARLVSDKNELRFLVADTLRMRPDRLVVGEVRTAAEAAALMDALLSGSAKGAFATFHAESAAHALNRLLFFGVPAVDLDALDLLAVLKRHTDVKTGLEKRMMVELCAVKNSVPVPVFFKGILNPDFFQTRAFAKMSQCHGVEKTIFQKRLDAEVKRFALE